MKEERTMFRKDVPVIATLYFAVVITIGSCADIVVNGNNGTFQSPGYPQDYPNNCNQLYRAVLSTPGPQQVHIRYDYKLYYSNLWPCADHILTPTQQKLCGDGSEEQDILVAGNEFTITFVSSPMIRDEGFVITYYVLPTTTSGQTTSAENHVTTTQQTQSGPLTSTAVGFSTSNIPFDPTTSNEIATTNGPEIVTTSDDTTNTPGSVGTTASGDGAIDTTAGGGPTTNGQNVTTSDDTTNTPGSVVTTASNGGAIDTTSGGIPTTNSQDVAATSDDTTNTPGGVVTTASSGGAIDTTAGGGPISATATDVTPATSVHDDVTTHRDPQQTTRTTGSGIAALPKITACKCAKEEPPSSATDQIAQALMQKKTEMAAAIKKDLTMSKSNVSASVRRKTSAVDERDSSTYMGFVIGLICFFPLVLIVVSDCLVLSAQVIATVRDKFQRKSAATITEQDL